MISDVYQLIGDRLELYAHRQISFTEDCLRHSAARDVEQSIFPTLTHASPQPMKLMPRIYGVVQQYLPAQIAESMSRDMMIRFQASRVNESFTREACTGLNPTICAQVYIIASLGSRDQWSAYLEEPWMKACGNKLTVSQQPNGGGSLGSQPWIQSFNRLINRFVRPLTSHSQLENLKRSLRLIQTHQSEDLVFQ